MAGKKKKKLMKKLHKWPALVISVFIIIWAISGIVLNHRATFSSFDVNRKLLPEEHTYQKWNNAAIRGSVRIDSCNVLFYGNIGVWEFDELNGRWKDMRSGFPEGADHFKINGLLKTSTGSYYAGTRFGFYMLNQDKDRWIKMDMPHKDKHVVDLIEVDDSLLIMGRSHLWKMPLHGDPVFSQIHLLPPVGYDQKVGLFKTLWVIHSGEIYGLAGKLLVDFVAIVFVFLTISGLIYFFFPRLIKKRKKMSKGVSSLVRWNRFSIKWHNKIGIWLVLILLLTACTGIFLRPPLLIAIANARVGKIPWSVLDDGNPWHDQLRRMLYDEENKRLLIATSSGIYNTKTTFNDSLQFIYPQPPASVMGYNVFAKHPDGNVLVGSFSGLYSWDLENGKITDYISRQAYKAQASMAMPISANMITGYHIDQDGIEFLFDYNSGVAAIRNNTSFPTMIDDISQSRMPLWNFALEVHTARIFKPIIGDFYILFIPLFGLATILILISGVILWLKRYRRKS
jgi:hypothetical protein